MIATLECVIGICLLANRGMRLAIWLPAIVIKATCERNHISEADFYAWRETSLAGATEALSRAEA